MKAYAVIQTGGKQYRVEAGGILSVERLAVKEGDKLVAVARVVAEDNSQAQLPMEPGSVVEKPDQPADNTDKAETETEEPQA